MAPGGFRAAYTTQGVSSYYTTHGGTYRNPHFPGVVKCIHAILSQLLLTTHKPPSSATSASRGRPATNNLNEILFEIDTGERCELPFMAELQAQSAHGGGKSSEDRQGEGGGRRGLEGLTVFDLAAGGGEATVAVRSWVGEFLPSLAFQEASQDGSTDKVDGPTQGREGSAKGGGRLQRKGGLKVYASDPFTSRLYEEQVNGLQRDESTLGEDEIPRMKGQEGSEGQGEDGNKHESEHEGEHGSEHGGQNRSTKAVEAPLLRPPHRNPPPLPPHFQRGNIPLPSPQFIRCYSFSFRDISLHGLDTLLASPTTTNAPSDEQPLYIDMTIISFALHLCPTSELFSLLYEISRHSAYLVVVAPHKNPHIPGAGEWGWIGPVVEVLVRKERVRGRVFRNVNF